MKEDRVIEELADWLVVVLEIEESVNESQTKHLGVEKLFDLAGALAWQFAVRGVAFQ
jgi:predicted house-cleaning noncanonical NTP pyrophosphatase (MazG superfamily)